MNVTDDVIRDLLVICEAGEASADTRRLVEAYLVAHPEFTPETRRPSDALAAASGRAISGVSLASQVERTALARTKHLLRMRSLVMAAGIFFTILPASFVFDGAGIHWAYWPAHPVVGSASWAVGVAAWIYYFALGRRLGGTAFS